MIYRGEGNILLQRALSQADPSVEIVSLCRISHYTVFVTLIITNLTQIATPQYPLLLALYFRTSVIIGITFHVVNNKVPRSGTFVNHVIN